MILLVGGEKGGSGKTTIACNLAIWSAMSQYDTLIIDADPQASASRFFDRRTVDLDVKLTCIRKHGDLYSTSHSMAERFSMVIIDTGGRDSKELRTAMVAADHLIIPIQPSQLDLETLPYLDEIVTSAKNMNARLSTHCVISRSPNHPSSIETREARVFISQLNSIQLSRQTIKDRKVYRDAFIAGLGVVETMNSKARAEIQLLAKSILETQTPPAHHLTAN